MNLISFRHLCVTVEKKSSLLKHEKVETETRRAMIKWSRRNLNSFAGLASMIEKPLKPHF